MACVDLPAFPLQLLLGRHPDWRGCPAAVVDHDRSNGTLLWVNERARARQILPGMRYASALTLAGDLRAAEVGRADIDRETGALGHVLRSFTPSVEPALDEPGVFWLDASGLERLYESLLVWSGGIRAELRRSGLQASVAVGFSRFGTYAAARSRRGVVVFRDPDEERTATLRAPLDRLGFAPAVRETLSRLGIDTLGRFVDLPPEGLEKRFGSEVLRLHRMASGRLQVPLVPERPLPPAMRRQVLDHPETGMDRLVAVIERLLGPLLATLADRAQTLREIEVGFRFERLGDHIEKVRPASPTRDARQLLELIRLRLQAVRRLPDGVTEVVLVGHGVAAAAAQASLFGQPRRDLAAANRALARLRAELGEGAVVRAGLREGHLPEGRFSWEALDALAPAQPVEAETTNLVRRIYDRPQALPARPRQEPDGWMLHGLEQGPVTRVHGPYVVSGGWWRKTTHREYHFAETQKGDLLWVFYDRLDRRWFLQGRVE
jgi:protein ImuB